MVSLVYKNHLAKTGVVLQTVVVMYKMRATVAFVEYDPLVCAGVVLLLGISPEI